MTSAPSTVLSAVAPTIEAEKNHAHAEKWNTRPTQGQSHTQPQAPSQGQLESQGQDLVAEANSEKRGDAPVSDVSMQNMTTYAKHVGRTTTRDLSTHTFAPEPWLQYGDDNGHEYYRLGSETPEPVRSSRHRKESGDEEYKFSLDGILDTKLKDTFSKLDALCQETLKNKRRVPACMRTSAQRHDSHGCLPNQEPLSDLSTLTPRKVDKSSLQTRTKDSRGPKLGDTFSKLEALCQETLKNKRHVPACKRTSAQRHDSHGSLASLGSLGNLINLMPHKSGKGSPQIGVKVPNTPQQPVPSFNVETASPLPSTLAEGTKRWSNVEPDNLSPSTPVSTQVSKPEPTKEPETGPTNDKKSEEPPPQKKEGWFASLWKWIPKLPARGHTGEELSMYFDKDKGKWINPNEPEEEDEAPPPPPPKTLGYVPSDDKELSTSGRGAPTLTAESNLPGKALGTPNGLSPGFGPPMPSSGASRKKARARYVDPFANG
ncbi:hypothetical protein SARC_02055 [Sphaeroforma arctica JP610]|uniref:Uncharacterized protein n=1 Tax=Sphaeroforma arctica JP610 TaxID=667725 RepID=A0A0L0G9T6_9EUKA|nr:hypothetical protein SARC_02055 [Sphaeroforma arctica JP610]KNC85792.1 hypothetical protein SARC_02055 [Sphaeroforma arctica JP610]|eukprot:XP_014159694.1 hypothetical protein SARC_02055 [Sphaeroforma arctica JP610]